MYVQRESKSVEKNEGLECLKSTMQGEIIGVYDSKQKAIKLINESHDYNNDELEIKSFESQ